MEKTIEINGKIFKIRELKAIELDDINWDDKKEALKKQITLSTGISENEYFELTVKERLNIVKTINELNGYEDFQKPASQ